MNNKLLPRERVPWLIKYILPRDWVVLAVRTDADNDYLSFKAAAADDFWFHVRGMTGSHVILKCPAGKAPDRETLKRAAAIAAYHSKARGGGIVAVSCTRARYVTKPKNAKPGTVRIRKDVVLKVRPKTAGEVQENIEQEEIERSKNIARATIIKDQRMNIRISKKDLDALKIGAIEEGMPHQTLVSSILHKYLSGKLVDMIRNPVDQRSLVRYLRFGIRGPYAGERIRFLQSEREQHTSGEHAGPTDPRSAMDEHRFSALDIARRFLHETQICISVFRDIKIPDRKRYPVKGE